MLSWTKRWNPDIMFGGKYYPATPRRCSDTISGEYIQPETDFFDKRTVKYSRVVPSMIVDPGQAGHMPKVDRTFKLGC
jgi:hypothetical protein